MQQEVTAPGRALLPLLLLAGFLFLFQLGRRDLTSSHEARAAQNAQRMLDDRSFGLPVLFDGQIDLQKPPGFYWLVALCGALDGGEVTPFTARLPAALAGLATVAMVFLFLRRRGRETAAGVAALALMTAFHFTGMARTARIDMVLAAAVCAAVMAFFRGCEPGERWRTAWHLVAALAAAAAILLKGPIGLALVGSTAAVLFLVERQRHRFVAAFARTREEPDPRSGERSYKEPAERLVLPLRSVALGTITMFAVALPWFVWANAATAGEFVQVFVWHHNVARFLGTSPTLASHPWWYYVPRFAIDFLPWSPVLGLLVAWAIRSKLGRNDPLLRLGLVWLIVMVGVLSLAKFKRADYLLPAYPGAALALGCAAEAWWQSRTRASSRRLARGGFAATVVVVVVGWQVMIFAIEPRRAAKEEKRDFAAEIRRHAPQPNLILLFRVESHLLAFHLGRPLHTLVEWGELNERLKTLGPHYIVTQPLYAEEAKTIVTSRQLREVARLEDFTSVPPAKPLVFLQTADRAPQGKDRSAD